MITKSFHLFPVLETDRLLLRQIGGNDLGDLHEVLSDPEVAEFEFFYPVKSESDTQRFIRRYESELSELEEITWGVTLKETGKLIGTMCLGDFDDGARRAEIGYALSRSYWGRGYATEAGRAVVKYGFTEMNLNRIEATITPGNDRSVNVLKKLKFTQEGIVRERDLIKGRLEDGIILALLHKEYI